MSDSTIVDNSMRGRQMELETLLKQAAINPAYRLQFYQQLIQAKVYVLGDVSNDEVEVEDEDKRLSLVSWEDADGNPIIPIFSSIVELGEGSEEMNYICIDAKTLFQSAEGQTFVLNPLSDYGKELLPSEIESLLDGSLFENFKPGKIEKGQKISIGQPEIYPRKLIEQLKLLFTESDGLQAAYLAEIWNEKEDAKPHLIIAIKGRGDFSKVISAAGYIVQSLYEEDDYVDFYVIDDSGEISMYFEDVEPFYCE